MLTKLQRREGKCVKLGMREDPTNRITLLEHCTRLCFDGRFVFMLGRTQSCFTKSEPDDVVFHTVSSCDTRKKQIHDLALDDGLLGERFVTCRCNLKGVSFRTVSLHEGETLSWCEARHLIPPRKGCKECDSDTDTIILMVSCLPPSPLSHSHSHSHSALRGTCCGSVAQLSGSTV